MASMSLRMRSVVDSRSASPSCTAVDARSLNRDVDIEFKRFILLIVWYAVFPRFVRRNQREVKVFNPFHIVQFAPIGFEVEFVEIYGKGLNIPQRNVNLRWLIRAGRPFCHQFQVLLCQPTNALLRLRVPPPPCQFSVGFKRVLKVTHLLLVGLPNPKERERGFVTVRILADQFFPHRNRRQRLGVVQVNLTHRLT